MIRDHEYPIVVPIGKPAGSRELVHHFERESVINQQIAVVVPDDQRGRTWIQVEAQKVFVGLLRLDGEAMNPRKNRVSLETALGIGAEYHRI